MSKIPTPMKAIRNKCLDCCYQQSKEVELCGVQQCSLWIYRFGKTPKTLEKHGKGDKIKIN